MATWGARIATWCGIALLVVALGFVTSRMNQSDTPEAQKTEEPVQQLPPEASGKLKKATLEPGRVVELTTTRGIIDFVLFEKDCPRTTRRIVGLVQDGCYNGVKFPRVEGWVIQIDDCKRKVKGMNVEVLEGLVNAKGSVGMARIGGDYKSNTSVFYILLEPAPTLNKEYTVFGRLIKGMDVAMKIQKGDVIKTARLRPLTAEDRKRFDDVLKIESERKTE